MEEHPPHNQEGMDPLPTSKTGIFYIIAGVLQIFTSPFFFQWWQNEPEYMGPLTLGLVLAGSSLGLIFLGVRRQINPNTNLYISALSVLTIVALLASLNMVGNDISAMEKAAEEDFDQGIGNEESFAPILGLIILFIVGPVFMFHMVNSVVLLATYRIQKSKEANEWRVSILILSLIFIPILAYVLFKALGVPTNTSEYTVMVLANICLIPSGIISLAIVYFQTRRKKQD